MAETLEHVWTSGPQGHLSPLETLKAWALRKVYLEEGYSEKGFYAKIASKVAKVGGGQPGPDAVRKLLLRIEEDPSWFPGKKQGVAPGRKRALSEQARQSIKRSAEAIKESGLEPTYPLILARCPNATRNPDTGEPVDKRAVYDVFRTLCYDEGAEVPWDHVARLQKTALSAPVRERRAAWAAYMVQEVGHTAGWHYRHVVWTDLCHSLLPRTEAKAQEQALARKGKKGWCSADCKEYSRNLQGKREALKQNSWGVEKVWWAPFLTRGKLHVELLPANFLGEKPACVHELVQRVPPMLNVRFGREAKPRILMTDRGPAFYQAATGHIVPEYKAALDRHGLRAVMGEDASDQSGDSQEVMLHETAVAWLRKPLALSLPAQPWLETREAFGSRLKAGAAFINETYDVDALCREFPDRLQQLLDREGDRLRK